LIVANGLEARIEEGLPGGGRIVYIESEQPVEQALEAHGQIPLPPYIDRTEEPMDRERYQTVYARDPGSVAAPTAGLHFTSALMESLELRGVQIARISLHVGPGTFRPVSTHSIDQHRLDPETWEIPVAAADAIRATRGRGGRVWAVGTTVVRTLETAAREDGTAPQGEGSTGLFITPGFRFRVVDALITNFHLPRSTLLMLVAAFVGYEATMRAYDHAVRSGYRFYSYGDAMAVLPAG
jgi:S-adenosylmethionine:tRNA ribosyltransferase-isomerase